MKYNKVVTDSRTDLYDMVRKWSAHGLCEEWHARGYGTCEIYYIQHGNSWRVVVAEHFWYICRSSKMIANP